MSAGLIRKSGKWDSATTEMRPEGLRIEIHADGTAGRLPYPSQLGADSTECVLGSGTAVMRRSVRCHSLAVKEPVRIRKTALRRVWCSSYTLFVPSNEQHSNRPPCYCIHQP